MTGEQFHAQAIEWFGEHGWQTAMSQMLGVNRTTVWRYANAATVPGPVAAAVKCWQKHGVPENRLLKTVVTEKK